MKTRIALLALAVLSLLWSGCSSRRGAKMDSESSQTRAFPVLRIPSMYTTAEDRMAYAAEHYWDSFLSLSSTWPSDSLTTIGVPSAEVESHFATYVEMLEQVDIGIARKSAASLFRKVEAKQKSDSLSNVYARFAELAAKYLYDPNSPYRCEDIYLPFVTGLSESPLTSPQMKPAYIHDARMCSLNGIGSPAADFVFKDIYGRTHTLYGVEAEYTLLFFSNPGCEACKVIVETLRGEPVLADMVSRGILAVVNVYIDEDIEAWKSYQDYYPKDWNNGYDPTYTIRQDIKYNVRAIPSLYVLDSVKRVIMKDAPEERVFAFLKNFS